MRVKDRNGSHIQTESPGSQLNVNPRLCNQSTPPAREKRLEPVLVEWL